MSRARAALLMAGAAGLAASAHVLLETPAALRDWRQTVPLALALGAAVGWLARPTNALAGCAAALLGLALFVIVFAAGHGAIEALRGNAAPLTEAATALSRVAADALWPGGPVLAAAAAGAGWIGGARLRSAA